MIWKLIAGAVAMGLLMVGSAQASPDSQNLYERAEREGNFKTFLARSGDPWHHFRDSLIQVDGAQP